MKKGNFSDFVVASIGFLLARSVLKLPPFVLDLFHRFVSALKFNRSLFESVVLFNAHRLKQFYCTNQSNGNQIKKKERQREIKRDKNQH